MGGSPASEKTTIILCPFILPRPPSQHIEYAHRDPLTFMHPFDLPVSDADCGLPPDVEAYLSGVPLPTPHRIRTDALPLQSRGSAARPVAAAPMTCERLPSRSATARRLGVAALSAHNGTPSFFLATPSSSTACGGTAVATTAPIVSCGATTLSAAQPYQPIAIPSCTAAVSDHSGRAIFSAALPNSLPASASQRVGGGGAASRDSSTSAATALASAPAAPCEGLTTVSAPDDEAYMDPFGGNTSEPSLPCCEEGDAAGELLSFLLGVSSS